MLADQLRLLLDYYLRPWVAASNTMDRGRLAGAVLLAALTATLWQGPWQLAQRDAMRLGAEIERIHDDSGGKEPTPEQARRLQQLSRQMLDRYAPPAAQQAARWAGAAPESALRSLVVLAVIFAPVSILLLSRWESMGRSTLLLTQNLAALVSCLMLAWTASHLPWAILGFWWTTPWLGWAMLAHFLVLAALSLRTVLGSSLAPAAGTALVSVAAAAGGGILADASGGAVFILASPCVLYYLWSRFHGDLGALGSALRHQQSFRRHLEALTLNPRDADAHYQLGLLYRQRHDLAQAESRFRQAVEIDVEDADYLFQLGRLLREQGKAEEALGWLRQAAQRNDKASNSEVWREIGGAQLTLGRHGEAVGSLARYVERREYDPEGLVLYGQALRELGQGAEARQAFERAVEAVRTMPNYRKGETRRWGSQAKRELSSLG